MLASRAITSKLFPAFNQALRVKTTPNMSLSFWTPRPFHSLTTHPSSSSSGFSSLFRMLDDFERYAHGSSSEGALSSFAPKFDVTEQDKEYDLQGELPGVPSENVEIEFTDPQTMVIRGHAERKYTEGDPSLAPRGAGRITGGEESKKIEGSSAKMKSSSKDSKKEGESSSSGSAGGGGSEPKYWLSERSYGSFSRVFNFPSGVDQDGVTAKFKDGILDIKVPKKEKAGGKKIPVQ